MSFSVHLTEYCGELH